MPVENASDKWTAVFEGGASAPSIAIAQAAADAAEGFAIDASGSASTAGAAASTATAQAAIATAAANAAIVTKNDVMALGEFNGVYATKALANDALAADEIAVGDNILVQADESQAGQSWRYQRVGAALVSRGAAVNVGPVTIPGGTLSGAGAVTTVPIDFQAPNGAQTNSGGGDDAVNWQFVRTTGKFTQGPTGFTNYHDNTLSIVGNVTGNLTTRYNAAMPIQRIAMESKFAQGGATDAFIAEWHLISLWPLNAAIGEYRGISGVVPHDHTKWEGESSLYFRGGVIAFAAGGNAANSYAGSDIYAQIDVRSSTARFVDFSGTTNGTNFRLRFNKNGNAIIQQLNAAGNAQLNHPFFDTNNALNMGSGATMVANGVACVSTITTLTGMLSMNASGMAAGGHMAYLVSSSAVTGNMTASYFQYNATGYGEHTTINTAASGSSGYRTRVSAGRMYMEFHDNTGGRHIGLTYYPTGNGSLALDDAQQGGQYATKNSWTVDYATFQTRFGYAPRLVNSTVAALPAAATAGAGSIQYVTDLNATTAGSVAAGGGSNKGMVVCSGADWRIVAAW